MNKVQEALKDDVEMIRVVLEGFQNCAPKSDGLAAYRRIKSALSDIEKCEPVALVALNNVALQKRIDVLEDLLTSAAVIAGRNGEGTHWERFIGQLKVNGIGNITAKTFRVLPSDEGYTSQISKEAYDGAREDLAIWKKRALEAEEKVRIFDQRIVDIGVIAITPISKEWVGLTDDDIKGLPQPNYDITTAQYVKLIEAKLKQLNVR